MRVIAQCACFCVVKAGGILVPDPVTLHRGRRCDCAMRMRGRDPHMHVYSYKHACYSNSDTETETHMRGLHDGEIRFTSMSTSVGPSLNPTIAVKIKFS